MTFVTVHILHTLPLHNMNRDQSGLPKSQFDGGVQRARLSSQALKRAARINYVNANTGLSVRTRNAVDETLAEALAYATQTGLPFDAKAGRAAISKVIKSLSTGKVTETTDADDDAADSDNILFFARNELVTLGIAAVTKQQSSDDLSTNDFIQDATSPSLDVAAFGRMFANATDLGTHAAIAVSHAATTHQMALMSDYFSAVEEAPQADENHAGAAHIGMSYYTSGVYYRSFTIDTDQLRRSWQSFDADGAPEDLATLVKALIRSLPSGRVANSNPHTTPSLVLAETQHYRTAYAFDAPVEATTGGYTTGSIQALAVQRNLATRFDPANSERSVILGDTGDTEFVGVEPVTDLDALVRFVVAEVYGTPA